MKTLREYPKFIVSKKGVRWLDSGHPWTYASDILEGPLAPDGSKLSQDPGNGYLADVVGENGKFLGTGFVSNQSKIRVRIFSRNANDRFDAAFWKRRLQYAWDYRKTVMRDDCGCMRVIFGEADGFPGLTVDLFNDILVAQTLSVGMEGLKGLLFPMLAEMVETEGICLRGLYERNDAGLRELEGMSCYKGWFELPGKAIPDSCVTEICENGIRYLVDVENGQKTGFFLDQKYNRQAVARIARGKRVLDCFTHTGAFALNACMGGAEHVTAVDVSQTAIDMARANAERNGLCERMDFLTADVFDLLPNLKEKGSAFYDVNGGKPYDFIILDPPAFTKSRKTADNAEKGYKEINLAAMRLLPRGGYLATASCSHFMPCERFEAMLSEAAAEAGVQLKCIEVRGAAPDHPVLWNVPETEYLKFYLFQVI